MVLQATAERLSYRLGELEPCIGAIVATFSQLEERKRRPTTQRHLPRERKDRTTSLLRNEGKRNIVYALFTGTGFGFESWHKFCVFF